MKKQSIRITLFLLIIVLFLTTGCSNSDNKAIVGISWCEDITVDESEYSEDLTAYIDAVKKAGGKPVLLDLYESSQEADKALKKIDALIITGGEDINPEYYGQEPSDKLEEVNPKRDASDMLLVEAVMKTDIPVLAVCRGCQLINVAAGGTLTQDIPSQIKTGDEKHRSTNLIDFAYHNINIEHDSQLYKIMGKTTLKVNSWHHQAISKLADDYKIAAVSDYGVIEAIENNKKDFFLGIQFHPEWHVADGDMEYLKIFEALIEHAK